MSIRFRRRRSWGLFYKTLYASALVTFAQVKFFKFSLHLEQNNDIYVAALPSNIRLGQKCRDKHTSLLGKTFVVQICGKSCSAKERVKWVPQHSA